MVYWKDRPAWLLSWESGDFGMYEIAICDDDQEAIFSLEHQIAAILSDLGIQYHIVTFSSGEDLLQYMNENSTDFAMIFLDIVMKEKNGIDTAKAIRRINDKTGIIFTTFSDQYVFTGYEVHALKTVCQTGKPGLFTLYGCQWRQLTKKDSG